MTDIGFLIKQKLKERGMPAVWLARQLPCSRANIYKIFSKKSIDTGELLRISKILGYDFFHLYSDELTGKDNGTGK